MSSKEEEDHQQPQSHSERRPSNASSSVHSSSRSGKKAAKKRKREEDSSSAQFAMGSTLSILRPPDLPGFNLTSTSPTSPEDDEEQAQQWTTIENGRPTKKAKKIPKPESLNYPAITFSSDSRLNSSVKISDLQNLVLYLLADGTAPQWVSVRHRSQFRKVVVLMIPGLEKDMFIRKKREYYGRSQENSRRNTSHGYSPDDYYPAKLSSQDLPNELECFEEMFEHVWPVQTPGDDKYNKMHSPLHAMLTAPAPREKEDKKLKKKGPKAVKSESVAGERTRITEFLCSVTDLEENDYVLHPAMYDDEEERATRLERRKVSRNSQADGWVDTLVDKYDDGSIPEMEIEQGSLTAGRTVLAMDCEMCMTDADEFSLTRISIVAWDGSVVMDELVKPAKPITDYITMYSGITKVMLENVETTLQDIQQKLLALLTPQTILIGHSLNSDLTALKITHPYIIDTALIYPHPRGPPLKQSLKFLAQKFLNKAIQTGHGSTGPGAGHDSIEDARTCLDLVKQKCEKGKSWGANETGENLFKRLARAGVRYKSQEGTALVTGIGGKTSAAVDWGDPKKGAGSAATVVIGCKNDEEVVAGIKRAVLGDPDGKEVPGGGVDFVWGRMRELESLKGWWNENKTRQNGLPKNIDPVDTPTSETPTSLDPVSPIEDPKPSTPQPQEATKPNSTSPSESQLLTATKTLSQHIRTIYEFLPPCTALVIYSGSGDPREMSRLQQMQQTFKREYRSKKWDELSVRWTDVEEQALKRAAREARSGVGFVSVK